MRTKQAVHINGGLPLSTASGRNSTRTELSYARKGKKVETEQDSGLQMIRSGLSISWPSFPSGFIYAGFPFGGPGSSGAPVESNGLRLGGMEPHGNIELLAPSRHSGRCLP